jgi:hypothetical protein
MIELRTNKAASRVLFIRHDTTIAEAKAEYERIAGKKVSLARFKKLLRSIPVIHCVVDGQRNDWIGKYA